MFVEIRGLLINYDEAHCDVHKVRGSQAPPLNIIPSSFSIG
jgi:hypothetical protein